MRENIIKILGMSCNGCAKKIENALSQTNGIKSAHIEFNKRQANIQYDETQITLNEIQNMIIQKGYTVE